MKARLLLVVPLCVLMVRAADDPPPVNDLKAIQGTWNLIGLEVNGKPLGDSVRGVGLKLMFKDDKVAFQGKSADKAAPLEGVFKIDPTKKPKEIETTVGKDTELGIYDLDGDNLKVCIARAGVTRPTKFETKEGDGVRLFILKREVEKPKDK